MTPDDEARVMELVRSSAAAREAAMRKAQQSGKALAYTWPADIKRLGRLVEPALIRVSKVSEDFKVRAEARMLLKMLDKTQ